MGTHLPLNILFVVPYAPTPIRTRPYHEILGLAELGHRVTVATLWSSPAERDAAAVLQGLRGGLVGEPLGRLRPLWNCARALLTADPMQAHFSWHPALARRLTRMVDEGAFDVVHVEHLRGARYGLALLDRRQRSGGRRPPIVWDSVDCISTLFRRAARESATRRVRLAARLELARTERYEGRMAPLFDRVLVSSAEDRRDLVALAPLGCRDGLGSRLNVVPNGVDLEGFAPAGDAREPSTLVMTGKMSYHANATAAIRFVHDVMPAVWARRPDARLVIVGQNPPREVTSLAHAGDGGAPGARGGRRVVVTGTVDDIRPYLRTAALAVAPIQYAVGIQNKVLEAMACGTPVIATPQAVTALSARDGEEVLVGRSAKELADAVVALLGDPERREGLGRAGRSWVERHHSWPGIARQLADIYRDTIG